MPITITPPASMNTPLKKWRWAWRADEKLRQLHNWMGEWHTQGKTQNQYNNALPARVKNNFSYSPLLSEADWNRFVDWHNRLSNAVHTFLCSIRQPNTLNERDSMTIEADDAKQDAALIVDVDTDIQET